MQQCAPRRKRRRRQVQHCAPRRKNSLIGVGAMSGHYQRSMLKRRRNQVQVLQLQALCHDQQNNGQFFLTMILFLMVAQHKHKQQKH